MAMMTGVGGMPIILGNSWTPASLGATLKGWWDFSDASTLYTDAGTTLVSADGQAIYQANDKSGSGLHLTQATAAARPTYKTAIQNGRSIARFVDHSLVSAAIVHTATFTAVGVAVRSGGDAVGGVVSADNGGTGPHQFQLRYNGAASADFIGWSTAAFVSDSQAATTNIFNILLGLRRDADAECYVNGVSGGATADTAANVTNTEEIILGRTRLGTTGSERLTGDIAEAIYCDTVLSTADLNLLGAYLAAKWNISWSSIP